jgi:two-component system, cell cycle sensor histidine kinase DivJ
VSVQRSLSEDMRHAYSRLCAAWVSDRAAAFERPALQRLFKVIFAMPAVGTGAIFAVLCAGASLNAVFAALLIVFTATLMFGAVAANARKASPLLILACAGAGTAAGMMLPVTGLSALLPLILMAGGESYYVSRDAKLSAFAALGAAGAALVTGWFAGFGASGALMTFMMTGVSMAHLASLALRGIQFNAPSAEIRQASVADTLMAASETVRLRISLMGEVVEVEGGCAALLGASEDVLKGFGLYERVLVSDKVAYLSALDALRAGKDKVRAQIRLRNGVEDGAYSTFGMLFCKMAGDGIAVMIEAADEPVQAKPQQVSEGQIHADRYLAGVSHELRTPLNAILGFSDILRQDMFGELANERQREYVELIHQSGAHLLSVVNMILDVSKLDAGAYQIVAEPFEVEEAVSMSLAQLRGQAMAKKIDLTTTLDAAAGECTADRRAVQQIMINLLSNAVKFTPEGGAVNVTSQAEDGYLVLKVADSGIGISESDLERIGQPFYQAQSDYTRTFEGTGLGLSLVRGLVELHQGGLTIESETGKGTTVTVRLPMAGPSARGAAPVKLSERRPHLLPQGVEGNGDGYDTAIRRTA